MKVTRFRGKSMGGSSAINYMVYIRGNRRDYDNWAELGNPGWTYREVLPYFKKAENNQDVESRNRYYHGVNGPLNVERYPYIDVNTVMLVEAFQQRGLPLTDLNGERQIGTDIAQSTSLNGIRMSVNSAYIKPIRHKRPNLKIITQAHVTKILIDPFRKAAYGVKYIVNGIRYKAYSTKEIIVSAGSLNSPKLLMLSGIGPRGHLESLGIPVLADLRVGSNLMDHVTTDALILVLSNKTSTLVGDERLLSEIYQYHDQPPDKKQGPLSATGTLSATAFIKTEYSDYDDAPDVQFHFDGRNVQDYYADPSTYAATNTFPLSFYDGLAARPLLLTPKSRGYLLLNFSDPVFGQPLIYSNFFTVQNDVDKLLSAMRFVVSLEDTEAFKLRGANFVKVPVEACAAYPWGSSDYFACLLIQYTSSIYHPAGTCKMGPIWDPGAVVDPRLRVYGINKLRVVDASIMPVLVRGNTNAAVVMIGEKAADMIKGDWSSLF
ncbi:Glucose dehydrogenase [Eumeta japonica]|uniref:Glucose dehydrogenase n=1 Tax=Eumeta variegata TaxID=151549 RepID=A0A4C1Z2Q1_EUMVA|nr:Glucose dehydrogenase [Eumeta japonica]